LARHRNRWWHTRCVFIKRHAVAHITVTAFSHTLAVVRVTERAGENDMEFIARIKKFALADEGQDLLEYALLVALIALVSVTVIGTAGTNVKAIFNSIGTSLAAPAA
jgi:pilus assembly protein Flp/PilA